MKMSKIWENLCLSNINFSNEYYHNLSTYKERGLKGSFVCDICLQKLELSIVFSTYSFIPNYIPGE